MKIKILSPLWGYDRFDLEEILERIYDAGYDGIDAWIPEDEAEKKILLDFIAKKELLLVVQQHQAEGNSFEAFKKSFLYHLERSASVAPLLINSHTGRDYFSFEHNLELIDLAQSFSEKAGIKIIHETHRGRFGYSPMVMSQYFKAHKNFRITADLSHWVCVTESFLENFSVIMEETFERTVHIHARIGYEEGPQVPDPRAPEWDDAKKRFQQWWDKIVAIRSEARDDLLTFTTEFGPPPYLQTIPFKNKPVADQFEINCFMKNWLEEHYAPQRG